MTRAGMGISVALIALAGTMFVYPAGSAEPSSPGRPKQGTVQAGRDISRQPVRSSSPPRAVVFLINGYTGCCISKRVRKYLEEQQGVRLYVGNWNDLERKRNPGGFNPREVNTSDEYFVRQMLDVIAKIPEQTPLIIIGHSFGGDAVLQVAKRVKPRRIAFLGVLDPVGRGGLRENVTWPAPSNVSYFFNRWQQNPPFPSDIVGGQEQMNVVPFDSLRSGEIKSEAGKSSQGKQNTEKTSDCKTKYRDPVKAIPQLLSHSELPNDSCIQRKIIDILQERLFN